MLSIEIDKYIPRSSVTLDPDLVFDAKQLATHIRHKPNLKKTLIGALVWAELLERGEVRQDEDRAGSVLELAFEEHDQLGEILTDAVYN